MTLDEAIKEAKISAMLYEKEAHNCIQHGGSVYEEKARAFKETAEENEQIVEWLEELKLLKAREPKDIVRCAECVWRDKDNQGEAYCTYVKGLADVNEDSFCSYGERKESE